MSPGQDDEKIVHREAVPDRSGPEGTILFAWFWVLSGLILMGFGVAGRTFPLL